MKHLILCLTAAVLLVGMVFWSGGCQATRAKPGHLVKKTADSYDIACQLCYDKIVKIRRKHAKHTAWKKMRIIKKHMCPECKTEVVFYMEGGKPMIKCLKCVPEGVACDKCVLAKTAD